MKKLALIGMVVSAMLSTAPGNAGVEVRQSRGFQMNWTSPSGSAYIFASTYLDPVSGQVYNASLNISLATPLGFRYGFSNTVTIEMDPLGLRGTIKGQAAGNDMVPIVVDLQFMTSRVDTNLPFASAEVLPFTPGANAQLFSSRQARSQGSVTSGLGGLTVVDGGSFVQSFMVATAS